LSNGNTVFNYIDEHKRISTDTNYTLGMGILDSGELIYGDIKDHDYQDFISAYPPLIEAGYPTKIAYG